MWSWFVDMLRSHPEMAVVLTLGFGYAIGKLRLGTVALGAVVGVLIAGAIIGQIGVKPSSDLKTLFFLLFLFPIGYRTGPQFFSGVRSSGFPQIALIVPQLITLLVGGSSSGCIPESFLVSAAAQARRRRRSPPCRK